MVRDAQGMKKARSAMLGALVLWGSVAFGAEAPKEGKQRPQKPLRHEKLFADTKKYLSENAAKTAAIIKINAANLRKTVLGESQPAAKAKARQPKKAPKEANDQAAKSG